MLRAEERVSKLARAAADSAYDCLSEGLLGGLPHSCSCHADTCLLPQTAAESSA